MAQKNINLGSADYAGDGESLRSAFAKIQDNFVEIYATGIAESGPLVSDLTGDVTGSVFASDSTLLVNGLDGVLSTYNLDQAGATDGQALVWNDGNSRWQPGTIVGGGGGLANVVDDTTPQLGGDLDLNNFNIIGSGNIPAANLTGTLPALDGSNLTGVVASSVAFADVTATPTTLAGYGITDAYTQAQVDSAIADVTAGYFSFDITGDDSTVRSVTSGSTIAIKGGGDVTTASDVDGNITVSFTQDTAFGSLTGTPTTLSGYGITDAQDALVSGTNIKTINGESLLGSGNLAISEGSGNAFTNIGVGADDSTIRSISEGESFLILGGTGITTASDTEGNITVTGFDGAFSSLSATPTSISGYGITDPIVLSDSSIGAQPIRQYYASQSGFPNASDWHGAIAHSHSDGAMYFAHGGTWNKLANSATTLAGYGITDAFDGTFGSLTGTPTTLSGYGITDAFDGTFGSLTGTPTTLSGYGITDAYTKAEVDSAVADSFSFSVAADDSTLREISNDESIKFVGAQNVTTSSDAEGQITITGPDLSGYAQLGSSTTFTADVSFDTGVQEAFGTVTGATGVTALDCNNGHLFYLTGATGDITANFTNLGLTAEYATNLTVVIDQGGTEYEITAVQIGGVAQTIVWQGNSAPTGTANGVDSFSFTILNDGGTYVVLGQMVSFGGV